MRVAVSGSTGLIGSALVAHLHTLGYSVSRLVRKRKPRSMTDRVIFWDPESAFIDVAALEGHDAVVHLAGEPLMGLWTPNKKHALRASRVSGTALLARTITTLNNPPRTFVCASAIGYYGDRSPDESLDERAPKGHGFLSDLVAQWEEAAQTAHAAGTRVANTRFGLVLSPRGGALAAMLPIFKAGLGGRLGSGRQIWSWIALPDVVRAIVHAIYHQGLHGPINFAAPGAVSNREFTDTLGHVLHRPTVMAVPAFLMRMVLREMADEMLLSGVHVVPRKLLDSGYRFTFVQLEPALRALLARS
jgi:uncharacterized protein (TIGR01777 family)